MNWRIELQQIKDNLKKIGHEPTHIVMGENQVKWCWEYLTTHYDGLLEFCDTYEEFRQMKFMFEGYDVIVIDKEDFISMF